MRRAFQSLPDAAAKRWPGQVQVNLDVRRSICLLTCDSSLLPEICEMGFFNIRLQVRYPGG